MLIRSISAQGCLTLGVASPWSCSNNLFTANPDSIMQNLSRVRWRGYRTWLTLYRALMDKHSFHAFPWHVTKSFIEVIVHCSTLVRYCIKYIQHKYYNVYHMYTRIKAVKYLINLKSIIQYLSLIIMNNYYLNCIYKILSFCISRRNITLPIS